MSASPIHPVPAAAPVLPGAGRPADLRMVCWALLFGNFVIGCGVMAVAGALNDLSRSLNVSVAVAGQLISISAVVVCFGAPLAAGWVSGFDRRRLLTLSLVWYAVGHVLCALMPSYAALWPLRALTVLAAAVFTPQAAAAIGHMAPPEQRGRVMTFIFLGWSIASVLGMPMAAWLGGTFSWRVAFIVVGLMSLAGALWVARAMPDGVRPAALSRRDWKAVFTHPLLMGLIAVTALQSAGQFTVFAYFAPYYKDVLHATPTQISLMFCWFGAFGLLGNIVLTRHIDRVGAGRAASAVMCLMALGLLLWPLATSFLVTALVLVPWALSCFATNSAQQVRLGQAAPALAPALMALNSAAMYLGQAMGAATGGWFMTHGGYAPLSWVGLVGVLAAIALSVWISRQAMRT